ncbi:MAG: acyclic terpene utilization AtuA family protein, partial [Pseudomonadota bacterium]
MNKIVKLGGASGYWGESDMAWGQLLGAEASGQKLDYIVFDYLAEITMSIMAKMRAADPNRGYAPDFVSNLARHLPEITRQGVKICSNAGGVNPEGCAAAVRDAVAKAGLNLKVAVITGDDFLNRLDALQGATEMFTGEVFPDPETVVSANA